MTNLYFLDLTLLKRVNGIDNEMRVVNKQNYLSDAIIDRQIALLPLTNVVLTNIPGRYLIVADIENPLAKVKLFVDGTHLEFGGFFAGILPAGTNISVTSDIATNIGVTLIKQA